MPSLRDHQSYLILVSLQSCVVVGGSLLTGAFLKFQDSTGITDSWPYSPEVAAFLNYIRFWGFTFLLLPAAWVFTCLWLERRHPSTFPRLHTLMIGIFLLISLIALFSWTVNLTASPPPMGPLAEGSSGHPPKGQESPTGHAHWEERSNGGRPFRSFPAQQT